MDFGIKLLKSVLKEVKKMSVVGYNILYKKAKLNYYMKLSYFVEIDKAEDDNYYIATIPELGGGAYIGTGYTIEEALSDLEDIKRFYFKEHIEKNIEIPKPKGV